MVTALFRLVCLHNMNRKALHAGLSIFLLLLVGQSALKLLRPDLGRNFVQYAIDIFVPINAAIGLG